MGKKYKQGKSQKLRSEARRRLAYQIVLIVFSIVLALSMVLSMATNF
jgi:hypothetical protein